MGDIGARRPRVPQRRSRERSLGVTDIGAPA